MAATLPSRRPPAHHKSVSPQRVAQYDPYAHQLGSLSENVHRLLTERECAIYDRALTDYHRRRHIRAFMECLSHVLNTNQKRQLLIPIRDSYIKPSDLAKFNTLALEYGLATPLKKKKSDSKDGVKKIEIKRNPDGEWGFNIRGGSEHGIGIFVSSIEPGSNAAKSGLKAGDQIKKANDLNCESVTHHEAVTMIKNSKKLQLWVLSRGHIPTSRMAHKVYNWVDPQGRPASPPPDPFEVQEQLSSSSKTLMNQPDERKVTMMIENGQDLGISIRGGAEHGLGIYISAVEEGSVAEVYGVNVGDQILEVNSISFLGIVHSDAAHALRAQPCMVLKLKDVGKLPHSRVTTLGKTQWHPASGSRTLPSKSSRSPVFSPGYGTQMMLSDQESSFQVRGMMNEVARSVLTPQELNTFNYYVDQYDQNSLSVDDLVTPMLHLLTTPEKLQLLSEMHVAIKPQDLQRFNELTVHKALAVKKAGMYHGRSGDSYEGSFSPGGVPSHSHSTPKSKGPIKRSVVAQVHPEEQPKIQMNSFEAEDHTLTHDSSSEDGGRDKIPQRLSPKHATFHPPPPPPSGPRNGHTAKNTSTEDTWSETWNDSSMMSPPPKGRESGDTDSSVNVSEIEERVRSETEARLRREYEEQQQKFMDEQQRRLKQEQTELEEKLRRDAEESMKKQLREKEEALARMTLQHQDKGVNKAELEEEIKKELEEKIWREAEEHLRDELERKMQRELEAAKSNEATDAGAGKNVNEEQIRREMEQRFKRDYEEKLRREQEKWKKKEEAERRKQEQEAKARRDAEVARLEAEEQARIELEDRIRKEAEASARAEYEARLQHETEERARLAEEVKARKAMEERMEKERIEREKEQERERRKQREKDREREQERDKRARELANAKKAATNKQIQDAFQIPDAGEEEDDEDSEEEEELSPQQMTPEELEEQRMLEIQRRRRMQEVKEEQQKQEAQKRAQAAEKAKQDEELRKKRELARKREQNIRKMEQERIQKEAEARQKREDERKKRQQKEMEEKQSTLERDKQLQSKKKQEEEAERQRGRAEAERIRKQKEEQEQRKKTEASRMVKMGGKQVMVGGAMKNGANPPIRVKKQTQPPISKAAAIEDERDKAEQMLERKLREKKEAAAAAKTAEQVQQSSDVAGANAGPSFSYAGYDNLRGELKHVQVTKVVRKLGIAIDGGANTKQKAVIIREISPEGCAGKTAPDLKVNQQLLEVEGQSLQGIKHKDVVMCIKHAFEGELNKVIDFTVLEPYN